jgi:hypothetical protein
MKLSKLFVIALLAGTLGVIGCGDDTTTSDNGGNGGGSCNTGVCVDNSELRAACETAVELCDINPLPNCVEVTIADICEPN